MKIITVPKEQIEKAKIRVVQDGVIQEKVTSLPFVEFLEVSLENYEPLGKGKKAGRQADQIFNILESVNNDPEIRFENADLEVIEKAIEAMPWTTAANRLISQPGGYRDAVENAQDVKTPTKK